MNIPSGLRWKALAVACSFMLLTIVVHASKAPVPAGATWVLNIDGAIGPATSDYVVRGLEKAAGARAGLVVIELNTPGGLDGAMRKIISAILASPVPVASYVTPRGARAASAGTYIMYASHIAAMNEATNLGAATPVQIGAPSMPTGGSDKPDAKKDGDDGGGESHMERKMINDASAYIRGLAELRHRNAEWAETAVREAASLSATEALKTGVIDFIATNLDDLVSKANGRRVSVDKRDVTVSANTTYHTYEVDWRTELLATLTNPNMVLILGMFGVYGILLEFYNPGSVVPGTVGIICLILAGYALQMLPVNYAGLGLIAVGLGLMVAEAMVPSFGVMGIGGIISFVIGGIMLFDSDVDAFRIGWPALSAVAVISAGFIIVTINIALRMRRKAVTTGIDVLVGETGFALGDVTSQGQVRIGGEIWKARADSPIPKGTRIRVTAVDGMVLSVEPTNND